MHAMETTRAVREQRVALSAALVAYLEKLFLEKDRTHYASKRWWRAILIEYPKVVLVSSLLATIYFMLRTDPAYDVTIIALSAFIPVMYFAFIALGGAFRVWSNVQESATY
jgi:hypothetical protein